MQMQACAPCGSDCGSGESITRPPSLIASAQHKLLTMASLQPGEFVLDGACGDGAVTFAAALAVKPHGWVAAIDASDAVLNAARVEADERGIGNIGFLRMRPEDLHFRDGLFDAAVCLGLSDAGEPVRTLRELRRVLRPGGRAVVAVWGDCGRAPQAEISLCAGNTLAACFLVAGFRDVRVERLRAVELEGPSDPDHQGEFVVVGGRKPAAGHV